ncbi:MAG: hypothetical protein Kow00121_68360 [Elainellaceae cyanobacterium]
MLKPLSRRFSALFLSLALCISALIAHPNSAQASKVAASVAFDSASEAIDVVSIYETTPETQKDALKSIFKASKSSYKKAPGFNSFSVFASEDGTGLFTLAQWQDLASYEASLLEPADESSESSKSSKKKEKEVIEPTRTIVFEVDQTLAPAGMKPAIREDALIQFSDLTAKSAEDQVKVLASAEEVFSGLTQTYPAPRSAILLKGVDSTDVALLANWGYVAEFDDLTLVPSVALLSDDETALAETDDHLYQVSKVMAAKPAKEKDDD